MWKGCFVRFEWCEELEGKLAVVADEIGKLKEKVGEGCNPTLITPSSSVNYPFHTELGNFRFAYYDPLYDIKVEHYVRGKEVQVWNAALKIWEDEREPSWVLTREYYRVKEEQSDRATYKDIAQWLAQGKGQYTKNGIVALCEWDYNISNDDKQVPGNVRVRKWGESEWVIPTKEVLNGE